MINVIIERAAKILIPWCSSAEYFVIMIMVPTIKEGKRSEREVFFFFDGWRDQNLWAVRDREFKLHMHSAPTMFSKAESHLDRPLLYDMTNDVGESHDVYAAHPERVEKLMNLFRDMDEEIPYNWWQANQVKT